MPRINIEDSLYKDNGFLDLVIATGSVEVALGALVRAWTIAQKYWVPERKRIPRAVWDREKLRQAIIDCGMADENEDGVHMRGSQEQFTWLFQRSEAGKAPKKPRAPRPKKKAASQPGESADNGRSTTDNGMERNETNSNELERNETSSSFSFSSSFSSSSSDSASPPEGEGAGAPIAVLEVKNTVGYFIGTYARAFKDRYGARPTLTGKTQGQIKTFLKDTPLERACALIVKYCEMNDAWFKTKGHDFGTFLENVTKVGLALDTGHETSGDGGAGARMSREQQIAASNIEMFQTIDRNGI